MAIHDAIQEVNNTMTEENEGNSNVFGMTLDDKGMVYQVAFVCDLEQEKESVPQVINRWPPGWDCLLDQSGRQVIFLNLKPIHKDSWQVKTLHEVCKIYLNTQTKEAQYDEAFQTVYNKQEKVDLNDREVDQIIRDVADRMGIDGGGDTKPDETATTDASIIIDSYVIIDRTFVADPTLSLKAKGFYYYLHSLCKWPRNMCWPSLTKITQDLRISRSDVIKIRDELIAVGAITYNPGTGRRNNTYLLAYRPSVKTLIDQNTHQKIILNKKKKAEKNRRG